MQLEKLWDQKPEYHLEWPNYSTTVPSLDSRPIKIRPGTYLAWVIVRMRFKIIMGNRTTNVKP